MAAVTEADTLEDIDEALRYLSLVPSADRGEAWHAYMDAILEKRKQKLSPKFSEREKRIVHAREIPAAEA